VDPVLEPGRAAALGAREEDDLELRVRVLETEVDVADAGTLEVGDLTLDENLGIFGLEGGLEGLDDLGDRPDARLSLPGGKPHRRAPRRHDRAAAPSAASARFRSSMATVIGPTPPGTGVTAEATVRTDSKSTSPS